MDKRLREHLRLILISIEQMLWFVIIFFTSELVETLGIASADFAFVNILLIFTNLYIILKYFKQIITIGCFTEEMWRALFFNAKTITIYVFLSWIGSIIFDVNSFKAFEVVYFAMCGIVTYNKIINLIILKFKGGTYDGNNS